MLLLLITVCLFKAAASQISGGGNATAVYGGSAHYSCSLANPTGVLQVTWQRLFQDESVENLATYSKRFGERINEPFREKVSFTEASLSSTSITLNNVKWEDESCYICSFNVYPDGSKRKQTCLTVKGISKANTSHAVTSEFDNKDREVEFNCTATGKPAPTIKWDFSDGATVQRGASTTEEKNSDSTVTSYGSISLRVPTGWKGNVDCVLNSGLESQRRESITIPSIQVPDNKGAGPSKSGTAAFLIIAIVLIACVVVGAVIKWKRSQWKRQPTTPEAV